jgi:hypothetical protein
MLRIARAPLRQIRDFGVVAIFVGVTLSLGNPAAGQGQAPTLDRPPTPTVGEFDGTYAFVSSTKLTEMYHSYSAGGARPCPDWRAGPLTIVRGQAKFSTINYVLVDFEGTVGPQDELAMRAPPQPGDAQLFERRLNGRMDGSGTVRARLTSYFCNYAFVWRK